MIQVRTSPSYAGDPVHIDSSQLQTACGGIISSRPSGAARPRSRTSFNSITVALDNDGDVTVVVDGSNCASGSDLVEADLTVAPFLTATTVVSVQPPQVTPAGLTAAPANEIETGDSLSSGDSDVYTVFTVETSPVDAEQPVEISSPQLQSRCGQGWRVGARDGHDHQSGLGHHGWRRGSWTTTATPPSCSRAAPAPPDPRP